MWFESATVRTVRDTFPEWTAFVWAFFSYFGSVWFVAPAVVLALYVGSRERFGPWLGTVMGGYALMVGTKGYFAVDRPDVGLTIEPASLPIGLRHVYAPLVEVSSTSFPSGHAMAGTVVWAMLALELDVGTRRQRLIGAAAMVLAICVARVAVGLHFPIDVVVGVALAAGFVGGILALRRVVRDRYDRHAETSAVFAAVAVVSIAAFVVGGRVDAVALFGATIGGLLAWTCATPPTDAPPLSPDRLVYWLVGLSLLAACALVLLMTDWVLAWFGVGLFTGAVIVGLPRFVEGTVEPTTLGQVAEN